MISRVHLVGSKSPLRSNRFSNLEGKKCFCSSVSWKIKQEVKCKLLVSINVSTDGLYVLERFYIKNQDNFYWNFTTEGAFVQEIYL